MNVNKYLFQFLKIAFGILIFVLVLYAGIRIGTIAYDFGYRIFTEPAVEAAPGQDVPVQITKDMSGRELGAMLEEKGLVRDANLFYLQFTLSADSLKDLQPGVYTLNTSMTAKDMLVLISEVPETEESETGETGASGEAAGGTGAEASEGESVPSGGIAGESTVEGE